MRELILIASSLLVAANGCDEPRPQSTRQQETVCAQETQRADDAIEDLRVVDSEQSYRSRFKTWFAMCQNIDESGDNRSVSGMSMEANRILKHETNDRYQGCTSIKHCFRLNASLAELEGKTGTNSESVKAIDLCVKIAIKRKLVNSFSLAGKLYRDHNLLAQTAELFDLGAQNDVTCLIESGIFIISHEVPGVPEPERYRKAEAYRRLHKIDPTLGSFRLCASLAKQNKHENIVELGASSEMKDHPGEIFSVGLYLFQRGQKQIGRQPIGMAASLSDGDDSQLHDECKDWLRRTPA